jgi:hypothetical protein
MNTEDLYKFVDAVVAKDDVAAKTVFSTFVTDKMSSIVTGKQAEPVQVSEPKTE